MFADFRPRDKDNLSQLFRYRRLTPATLASYDRDKRKPYGATVSH
jgi:hypothetical protein